MEPTHIEYNNLLVKYPRNVGREIKNIWNRPSFFLSKKKANIKENTIYKRKIKLITDNQ